MKFTQIKAFHALAITGGFTKAAALLHVTQPAVTAQLKSLEQDYGVELFQRRGHDLEPTDVGRQLLAITTHIFGLLDDAQEVLDGASEIRNGQLRMGADSPFFIVELLARYRQAYPKMEMKVEMGSSAQCVEWLLGNHVDVAVMTAVDVPGQLYAEPFLRLDLMLIVPVEHKWARRRSIPLKQLASVPLVVREPTSMTRDIFERCMHSASLPTNNCLELHSQVAVREAVASGLGLAVELYGGFAHDSRLKLVPIRDCTIFGKEYIACHRNRSNLRKVTSFFELARDVAPKLPRAVRA